MDRITGKTRVLGIFGYPVEHTMSPLIQNQAIIAKGLDMVYLPFEVRPDDLKKAVEAIRALGLLGVNITIPHKEAVIPLLDEVSEEALLSGAVNTVVNRKGILTGYNTDGEGYVKSLTRDTNFELEGKNILILGAGGAARGILASIVKERPEKVIISNRTFSRALRLVEEFRDKFQETYLIAADLSFDTLKRYMEGIHLLINTTSMGMDGKNSVELPLNLLPGDAVVSDIVYKPLNTAIIKKAESLKLKTHKGLAMLLEQGALSFKIWTGVEPPLNMMKEVFIKRLRCIS